MTKSVIFAAALTVAGMLALPALAEGWALGGRSGGAVLSLSPTYGVTTGPVARGDAGRHVDRGYADRKYRKHSKWKRKHKRRRAAYYRPYYFYGERRSEPRTEVVVVEQPAAPPEPVAPPPPAPRIDACRTGADVAAIESEPVVGSGRVMFMAPPEEGCPRFTRVPASKTTSVDVAAQ